MEFLAGDWMLDIRREGGDWMRSYIWEPGELGDGMEGFGFLMGGMEGELGETRMCFWVRDLFFVLCMYGLEMFIISSLPSIVVYFGVGFS